MSADQAVQRPPNEGKLLMDIPRCQNATERPSPDDYESIVTIVVGEGDNKKTFHAHAGLLKHYSAYFYNACKPVWVRGDILLTDEDPNVLRLFFHWLYSGKLYTASDDSGKVPITSGLLCSLYCFSAARGIPELGNAAVDVLIQKFARTWSVPTYCLSYVYDNTPKSSNLRTLFVGIASGGLSLRKMRSDMDDCPKEFLLDLIQRCQELDICPGDTVVDKQHFLANMISDICKYHDHRDPLTLTARGQLNIGFRAED